ncbi:DNA adenine methylase [Methylomonas sp. MED-D]|uniref:DNA adenine methylase n=1 Tax=Methylomonas sp. MED-D TaxID=3418768 RepID=UPI003D07BDBB
MTFDYLPSESINGATDWSIQNPRAFSDAEIELAISKFPKTRYYGSKRRLLSWIYHAVKDLPFNTVLDGFGGTASVSLLFKAMGKQVYYHDALLSNTISAQALLADDFPFSNIHDAYQFIESIKPENGFIAETFANIYYTDEENQWLDGAAKAIHAIENPLQRSAYFYCLFQACLKKRPFNLFHRANLNLRLNKEVNRSFGNWATWEKTFLSLMKESIIDLNSTYKCRTSSVILEPGDIKRLDSCYDLVYLDPPYVGKTKTGDDYLRRYHFLEGLSLYNKWKENINMASSNKTFQPCQYLTDWQSKRIFRELIFDVIDKHKQSIVVLSYISNAHPSEEDISDFFKSIFKKVQVYKQDFCHALAKEKKEELLFIGFN